MSDFLREGRKGEQEEGGCSEQAWHGPEIYQGPVPKCQAAAGEPGFSVSSLKDSR